MISVLLSVYINDNLTDFKKALESVYLNQIYKPSELVIVFDGSVLESIEQYIKSKISENWPIVIVKIPINVGLGKALNLGLQKCKYDLIARMDSDDISVKERFLIQKNFFIANPEIDILGGYIEEFNESGVTMYDRLVPLTDNDIIKTLNYKNAMNHVTVMFRRSRLSLVGNYEERFHSFEDYGTWLKAINSLKFANLPIIFVSVKVNSDFSKRRSGWKYFKREFNFFKEYFKMGKINIFWFTINVSTRLILRNLPSYLLLHFYKLIRTKNK